MAAIGDRCEPGTGDKSGEGADEAWHWTNEAYPADAVSLRAITSDNFVIVDTTNEPRVIGETDFPSALRGTLP